VSYQQCCGSPTKRQLISDDCFGYCNKWIGTVPAQSNNNQQQVATIATLGVILVNEFQTLESKPYHGIFLPGAANRHAPSSVYVREENVQLAN